MGINNKEEFNLNDLCFEDVINGLNKYFAEDETCVRVPRSFVGIEGSNDVIFYHFDAEKYLDELIAWLRTEHGIFYYPGMEAKYAKAEKRIPPFTERMKNDGALRALKKLHKIVTNVEVSDKADSPTLIAAAIENDFAVLKQDLKNAIETKESFFEIKGKLNYRKELMEYITKTEKKHGICFSDLHDDEEFRPERIFDDLLNKMTRNEHILKDLYRDILHKQPDGLSNEDIATKIIDKTLEMKERLDHKEAKVVGEIRVKQCEEELLDRIKILAESRAEIKNSDINKLIRDYCTKNDIIAPSRYFSDKCCVEYLFSVVDLEREHRAAVGKKMVYDYEKDIMNHIRQEASRNGYTLPEKVDDEPLTIERVFHDLLELMRIRGEELRILKSKCDRLNEIVEELNTLNNEIKE